MLVTRTYGEVKYFQAVADQLLRMLASAGAESALPGSAPGAQSRDHSLPSDLHRLRRRLHLEGTQLVFPLADHSIGGLRDLVPGPR